MLTMHTVARAIIWRMTALDTLGHPELPCYQLNLDTLQGVEADPRSFLFIAFRHGYVKRYSIQYVTTYRFVHISIFGIPEVTSHVRDFKSFIRRRFSCRLCTKTYIINAESNQIRFVARVDGRGVLFTQQHRLNYLVARQT